MAKYNVKTIDKKTIEVEGKLILNPVIPKAPLWFSEFEKRIDQRLDKVDQRLDQVNVKLGELNQRIDNLVVKNNLHE